MLKNNFLKNYNELTQVKKENEFMKTKIEDVHHLLIAEKEDNLILKNKLQDFQDQYYIYKDNTTKKTNALENMLAKMRTKERECKIFHVRKGASPLNIRPKKREFGGSILEEKNENELDNNEIKGMNKTTSEIKKKNVETTAFRLLIVLAFRPRFKESSIERSTRQRKSGFNIE